MPAATVCSVIRNTTFTSSVSTSHHNRGRSYLRGGFPYDNVGSEWCLAEEGWHRPAAQPATFLLRFFFPSPYAAGWCTRDTRSIYGTITPLFSRLGRGATRWALTQSQRRKSTLSCPIENPGRNRHGTGREVPGQGRLPNKELYTTSSKSTPTWTLSTDSKLGLASAPPFRR